MNQKWGADYFSSEMACRKGLAEWNKVENSMKNLRKREIKKELESLRPIASVLGNSDGLKTLEAG